MRRSFPHTPRHAHTTPILPVLTLLLVVGAVTCSPLPSDFPAHAAQDAAHHVEVTHEVRHVTFEVSEEVSDATASSQVPSAVPPEDDPPIPTATTPPTLPDAHLPHHVSQLDLQPAHHTPPKDQGLEEEHVFDASEAEGFLSDEPSSQDAVKDGVHLGALREEEEEEDVEVEAKEDEGGLEEDTAAERVSGESASGEHNPLDIATGVVPEDTAAEESSLAEDTSAVQEQPRPESTAEGSATHDAELQEHVTNESAVEEHHSDESAIREETSEQSVAEESVAEKSPAVVEKMPAESEPGDSVPEDSTLGETKSTGSSSGENTTSELLSEEDVANEDVQVVSVTTESVTEEKELEKGSEEEAPVHTVERMLADETRETVVLAEPAVEESASKEEVQENKPEKETVSEKQIAEEDMTEMVAPGESEEGGVPENATEASTAVEEEVEEEEEEDVAAASQDPVNHEGEEEAVADSPEQDVTQEEPELTDVMDPRVKKEVEISEEEKRSAEETEGHAEETEDANMPFGGEASEEEETPSILVTAEDHAGSSSPSEGQSDEGGVAFVNDAPSSLDSSELSSEDIPIPVVRHLDTESDSGDEMTPVETPRKSRIYIEDDYEDPARATHPENPAVPEVAVKEESEHKVVNSGLESMSMTSPTPEVPPESVPVEVTAEEAQVPPANTEEIESVTPPLDAAEPEENVTTVIDKVEEPPAVHETEEEASVVDDVPLPPSSSAAPPLGEEYPDSYTDPLDVADLPDIDVTRENLPSKEHPLDKGEATGAGQPSDHAGEVAGGDSSDLAASDHMLEVEAGTPRVLPPQQEQVSAAAPTSLTVGCIIGIVFGVLMSLVILVGVGGFVLYQRRTLNRPKALNSDRGYAGSDSGGYIDDQVRVSYVNSQIDTPKGSPEDLISLDNDSFLNSLESMTIQNLWTDNIRHTKL
ncbi:neurofilament heavy polypeptide-like isoform X2 [Penaeus japonicus]|uniref:neurofilament heavy polypeptide-like isoform X2 n=1 Tax=Penaeus japonicus TaxID=27405 RepID=UPI001C70FDC4|nr:neurofilament heavy polypeptide-like isoform X2 [Penaeus japonicus]